jgi:pimeloyl-ACP methyl ester carboxylesterase
MADIVARTDIAAVEQEISRHRRLIARIALLVFAIYAAVCAFFYFRQDKMTFPAPASYPRASPLDAGLPFEDLHIPVNKSQQIHAWWIPADPASASADKVLLAFHGNGYVLEQSVTLEMIPLHSLGANLLLVDYRGYGSSSAEIPTEERVNEDARAAFDYLTSQREVPSRNIVLLGRSIGTGPATELAKEHADAGGLILISPFTSTVDIAKTIWYLRIFPLALLSHNRFDNLLKIKGVHIPIFIAVGSEDRLTPPAMAQALFKNANNPKQLYISPGADHNNIMEIGVTGLEKQLTTFLETIHRGRPL